MPKHAQIETGEILEFPDDTPDHVMDRTVRQHLQLPDIMDPGVEQQLFLLGVQSISEIPHVLSGLAQAIQQLVQSNAQTVQVLQALAQVQQDGNIALSRQIMTAARMIQTSNDKATQTNQNVLAVLAAPKHIKRDAKGLAETMYIAGLDLPSQQTDEVPQ